MDINAIEIAGTVWAKDIDHVLLSVVRENNKENFIRVWGISPAIKLGEEIAVSGELACGQLYPGAKKLVLGVKAKSVCHNAKKDSLIFTGTIIAKGKLRITPFGKRILDLTVKIDEKTFVPVVVWHGKAEYAEWSLHVGDSVEVNGLLVSRGYDKVKKGRTFKKITTEVSAISVSRI